MPPNVTKPVTNRVTPVPSLTDTAIAKLPRPSKGRALTFDSHRDAPKGFAVQVTAAGNRAFVLRYRADGRERRKVIGAFPTWSVMAARKEAQRLVREVDQGRDPLEEKRRRRLEPTFADVAREWLSKHASRLRSGRELERAVTVDVLPALGTLKISDLRRRDVIGALEKKFEISPRSGELLLTYCKQIVAYAVNREYIELDPVVGLKPAAFLSKAQRPRARERVLDDAEIRSLWPAAPAGMDKLTLLALRLILATGQRPDEVAGMALGEIDGDRWIIPASRRKTHQAHEVHLTATALALIEEARAEVSRRQKRRGGGEVQFVFESRVAKSISRNSLSQAVLRNSSDLGVKNPSWTPHDLRRTCRTRLSALGVAPHVAEAVIGHQRRGVLATYDRHGYQVETAAALQAWEARLLSIVNSNVLSFPSKPQV